MVAKLSLGRKVKAAPKKKWMENQERLSRIVHDYEIYKNDDKIFEYLTALSYNIKTTAE